MTSQQALEHLLNAARLAPLTYQQHATTDAAFGLVSNTLRQLEAEVKRLTPAPADPAPAEPPAA